MARRYRKGDRVESLRRRGEHGSVVRVIDADAVGVRWDGTSVEDEVEICDLRPSSRRAPAGSDGVPSMVFRRH